MAFTAERRSTPRRKREEVIEVKEVVQGGIRSWLNEALSLVCVTIAFFLVASIASHEMGRLAPRPVEMEGGTVLIPEKNIMGPTGHLVSTLLGGTFGWCSLMLVGWFFWVGVYVWDNERWKNTLEVPSKWIIFLGLAGLLAFSSTVAAIFWGRVGGGSFGLSASEPLIKLFSTAGATIIGLCFFFLSLAIATRRSIATILSGTTKLILVTTFQTAKVLSTLLLITVGFIVSLFRRVDDWISSDREEFDESEDIELVPTPRKRVSSRIKIPEDAQSWELGAGEKLKALPPLEEQVEALPDESKVVAESYSHVVVSRRRSPSSEAKKEAIADAKEKEAQAKALEDARIEAEKYEGYEPPGLELLTKSDGEFEGEDDAELRQKSRVIEMKLKDFGILGRVTQVHPGPVVTLFEFEPAPGVKVGRIASLQDDLAMSLKASSIRIMAPIPKKGTVGIEVPNKHRDIVRLRDLLESEAWRSSDSILSVPIGKDTYGDPVITDIATMPHFLMAGATGTGKSVCINTLLISLLYKASPAELGLILIDPKILELSVYEGIPHLRVPVVTVPRQAKAVLDWAVREMDRRYRVMQRFGVRSIDGYNRVVRGEPELEHDAPSQPTVSQPIELTEEEIVMEGTAEPIEDAPIEDVPNKTIIGEKLEFLPKIVIVIDELADLMLTVGRDIEELITRLAQKARAAGIHLIIATQRPSVDVITGLIKANFPARVSFRVTSRIDSRTILDSMGAEKLLGKGDMLLMSPGAIHLRRVHGAFISDSEVKRVLNHIKSTCGPAYDAAIMDLCAKALEEEGRVGTTGEDGEPEFDPVYDKAVELVLDKGQASTSMIQRAFRIGYNRAARIVETMEREGLIGPMDGAKPREVLVQNDMARSGPGTD